MITSTVCAPLEFWLRGGWALLLALALAAGDWISLARQRQRCLYLFKPATMLAVLLAAGLLIAGGPHDSRLARFFVPGFVLSLLGDLFLMLPGRRFFVPGLAAFLAAHLCYIAGLNPTWPPLASLVLLMGIVPVALLFYRRVAAALREKGRERLLLPTALYAGVLLTMLFSAWATLFRPGWPPPARAAVVTGATLFFLSDAMLAWRRFVRYSLRLHVTVHVTYHLAQIALAASIALAAG